MRFVFTILILMISGSFTASAGTCFQDCDDKIFVKRPNSLPSNPIRVLNKSNEYVLENINIDVFRDKPIGFKPHGLKIVYRADGEPVRTGKSSFKFEVRDGDCGYNPPPKWNDCKTYRERHELVQHTFFDGEIWLSYSIYLPKDYQSIENWADYAFNTGTVLGQIYPREVKDTGRVFEGPQFLFYAHNRGYLVSNFITNDHTDLPALFTMDEMLGKWNDVLIHMNATSRHDGFFRIYINGNSKPAYAYEGGITPPNDRPTFKFGIYRYGLNPEKKYHTQVVYYDNVFAHKECKNILPELGFDCKAIIENEAAIYSTRMPKMTECGDMLCPVRYGRSQEQIKERLTCLFKGKGAPSTVASSEQINAFAEAMADWDDFRMKAGDFYWSTFSPETLEAHGDEMIKTMNLLSDEAENFVCPN